MHPDQPNAQTNLDQQSRQPIVLPSRRKPAPAEQGTKALEGGSSVFSRGSGRSYHDTSSDGDNRAGHLALSRPVLVLPA